MKPFAIFTTQRSGSGMLVRALDSHPDIRCHGELFLRRLASAPSGTATDKYGVICFEHFARQTALRRIRRLVDPGGLALTYIDEVCHRQPDASAVGFKVMYGQAHSNGLSPRRLDAGGIAIIHLVRHNILRALVSREQLKVTGVAHTAERSGPVRVALDADLVLKRLAAAEKRIKSQREMLRRHHTVLEVSYEDYVADRAGQGRRLLEFLGVDPSHALTSGIVRQNVYPLSDVIENFPEVMERVRGSPYEAWFLESQP